MPPVGVTLGPELSFSAGDGGTRNGYIPGIIADGATDNTVAIASYLTAVANLGGGSGDLILPPGIICCDLTDTGTPIPEGCILRGSGSLQWGKTSGSFDTQYGTFLQPVSGSGQSSTVRLYTKYSGIQNLSVSGLIDNDPDVIDYALTVSNDFCKLLNVGLFGGSIATFNTDNAETESESGPGELQVSQVYTNNFTTTGSCLGGILTGHDWTVDNFRMGGSSQVSVSGAVWGASTHWIGNYSNGTMTYNILDGGGGNFDGCYIDNMSYAGLGTLLGALVDRTGASNSSIFNNCHFTENQGNPAPTQSSGASIMIETTNQAAGAQISGWLEMSETTWNFTNLVRGPVPTTCVGKFNVSTAIQSITNLSNTRPPGGSWDSVAYVAASDGYFLSAQSGKIYLAANGTSFNSGSAKDIFSESGITLPTIQKGVYRIDVAIGMTATTGDAVELCLIARSGTVTGLTTSSGPGAILNVPTGGLAFLTFSYHCIITSAAVISLQAYGPSTLIDGVAIFETPSQSYTPVTGISYSRLP